VQPYYAAACSIAHYYSIARCNPILPFDSKPSRLPEAWRLRLEQIASKLRFVSFIRLVMSNEVSTRGPVLGVF
jgi:hypothetical protein